MGRATKNKVKGDKLASVAIVERPKVRGSKLKHKMKIVAVDERRPQVRVSNSEASSPSSSSRYSTEEEYDPARVKSGERLMELNNSSQDLRVRVHENEQEIMQLRRQLADYSVKEEQIRKEKYVLEKRITYMRLIFDQQQ
ncbi:hypothetical protein M0R45_015061 [Rubus argutus]|uniref:Uncharacterized protein n=1 Tax=Rubus argutus TaxID=59490 RepID=A0AAW1XPM5_RUBAR